MTLLALVAQIAAVVTAMIGVTALLVVDRPAAAASRSVARLRNGADAPYVGLLVVVLAVNTVARRYGPDVAWLIGLNLTGTIYAIEGTFVAWIQSFASPPATALFAFAYVYGYVFLLVFPLVVYTALEDPVPLRETTLAYSLNYALGLACYLLFVAYGPRNLIPELVDPLLYSSWPQSQLVTSQVNTNSNVFPSLHASLSITVALLAYRTRDRYPRWLPLAATLATAIVVSTMYLGIHWGIDVVAGAALGIASVAIAARVRLPDGPPGAGTVAGRLRWGG